MVGEGMLGMGTSPTLQRGEEQKQIGDGRRRQDGRRTGKFSPLGQQPTSRVAMLPLPVLAVKQIPEGG